MSKVKAIGIELELVVLDETGTPRVLGDRFPYTKDQPMEVSGYVFHKDAAMLEIAFPPACSQAELDKVVQYGLTYATSLLPAGWTLSFRDAVEYPESELAQDLYASEMGCSPSDNIYGFNPMPDAYPDGWRYAGMHVNVSSDDELGPNAVHFLDVALAYPDTAAMSQAERELVYRRRQCYGRAGEYRQRPWGIEYRTLPVTAYQRMGDELFALVELALEQQQSTTDLPAMLAYINGE